MLVAAFEPIVNQGLFQASFIMGSLFLSIGTLVSLIWMHILKQNKIQIKWKDYLSVSIVVIPLTTIVTLFLLFYWVPIIFT
jgi:arsenical pump membrane protein